MPITPTPAAAEGLPLINLERNASMLPAIFESHNHAVLTLAPLFLAGRIGGYRTCRVGRNRQIRVQFLLIVDGIGALYKDLTRDELDRLSAAA